MTAAILPPDDGTSLPAAPIMLSPADSRPSATQPPSATPHAPPAAAMSPGSDPGKATTPAVDPTPAAVTPSSHKAPAPGIASPIFALPSSGATDPAASPPLAQMAGWADSLSALQYEVARERLATAKAVATLQATLLPAACCLLPAACYLLPATCYLLHAACCMLHAACSMPPTSFR